MQVKYRIVETFPDEHQIKVRFFTDSIPEKDLVSAWQPDGRTPAAYRTDLMLTLPVPVPEDLDAYIMKFCPFGWFDLKYKVADPAIDTSLSSIPVGEVRTLTVTMPGEE